MAILIHKNFWENSAEASVLFRFDPIAAKVIGNAFKSKAKWNPFTGVTVKCQIKFYFSAESWMLLRNRYQCGNKDLYFKQWKTEKVMPMHK